MFLHLESKSSFWPILSLVEQSSTIPKSYFLSVLSTILSIEGKKLNTLNKASGFIRTMLCDRIKIRKMPEIHFVYDESIEYGKKIEDIIERINNEK